jgi:hypothetical protein
MIEAFSQLKVDPQPALSERLSRAANAIASGQALPSLDAPAAVPMATETVSVAEEMPEAAALLEESMLMEAAGNSTCSRDGRIQTDRSHGRYGYRF